MAGAEQPASCLWSTTSPSISHVQATYPRRLARAPQLTSGLTHRDWLLSGANCPLQNGKCFDPSYPAIALLSLDPLPSSTIFRPLHSLRFAHHLSNKLSHFRCEHSLHHPTRCLACEYSYPGQFPRTLSDVTANQATSMLSGKARFSMPMSALPRR